MRPGLISRLVLIAALSAPVAAALFRVWVNQDAVQVGYSLSEATIERRRLLATLRELEVEFAMQSSPEQLERLARPLGLNRASPNQIVVGDMRPKTILAGTGGSR
jgi:cell division protein FtsL